MGGLLPTEVTACRRAGCPSESELTVQEVEAEADVAGRSSSVAAGRALGLAVGADLTEDCWA